VGLKNNIDTALWRWVKGVEEGGWWCGGMGLRWSQFQEDKRGIGRLLSTSLGARALSHGRKWRRKSVNKHGAEEGCSQLTGCSVCCLIVRWVCLYYVKWGAVFHTAY